MLEKSLKAVLRAWKEKQDWEWTGSQMKSIRQDLSVSDASVTVSIYLQVQHIRTEFTVKVYEIHARLCLENADLGEFNQCQSKV